MRFVASGPIPRVAIVVHDDGRIERARAIDARIVAGRILCPDGSEVLNVDGQDRVLLDGRVVGRLTPRGAFAIGPSYGAWTITVLDDGSVSMTTRAEGRTSTDAMRWEGFRPEARRTAGVLTALLTPPFGGRWCGS
jgi:hypothetical protein